MPIRFPRFSRPKGPGFGLSKSFYLSVLSSSSVLPTLLDVVSPKGEGGSVPGFGAPLDPDASKETLRQPLGRGAYVVASLDRKTALRMLVLSKEEAGFDPETFARSAIAQEYGPELLSRVRGTWTLVQFAFESHDPDVYPALDFLLSLTRRFAELSQGVVADTISRRYLLPEEVMIEPRSDPRVDAREHVSVTFRERPDGYHSFTLGMQKFALPEFEMTNLLASDSDLSGRFLMALCQSVLMGDVAESGDRFGAPDALFEAREGGFDRAIWEGIPVLELLPPTTKTSTEALDAWFREIGRV